MRAGTLFHGLAIGLPAVSLGTMSVAQVSITPAPPVAVTVPSCQLQVVRVDATASTQTLYANCGGGALRLGEAAQYSVAVNPVLGTTLVVRQGAGRTDVDLVWVDAGGAVRLDELAGELVDRLAKAGGGRPRAFAVDLSRFAIDGRVSVSSGAVDAAAIVADLSVYGRPAAVAAQATAGG